MKKFVACFLSFTLFCFSFSPFASAKADIVISAEAAVLICADSYEVLYTKQSDKRLPMASTTKIMTALLLAEQPNLQKTITVTEKMVAVEGSSMGLLAGDTVSYNDLLYGLLLASGNDAANTVAFALAGSTEGFVMQMNARAVELGMKNTCFATPSGLDADNHYSTAYDMAILTIEALKNDAFAKACSTVRAVLNYGNPPYRRSITNHNKLLNAYDGLIGVKTGFTKKAGRCLVTAAERDGKKVIAVTLNAPDDWSDHKALLDYAFSVTVCREYACENFEDTLDIISANANMIRISYSPPKICTSKIGANNIKRRVILPEFVYAPVSAGQVVGRVEYLLSERVIASVPIYSLADAELENAELSFLKRFFSAFCAICITM